MKTIRTGKGKGLGKGYKNIMMAHDKRVHRDAGLGRKQPQRMPNLGAKFAASSASVPNIKLEQVGGDINWETYNGTFMVKKKFNNGDFDYYLFIDFINLEESTGEKQENKYAVEIKAVAPSEVKKEDIDRAFESMGMSEEFKKDPKKVAMALNDYGVSAIMDSSEGNNAKELMQEAKKQIPVIEGMFGFYMDRPLNMIGNTGWDFIKGDLGIKR